MIGKEKQPKKSVCIFNNVISPDTAICRYMDFDAFLYLLNGHFYVPRKQNFLDIRESGKVPLKYQFLPTAVGCVDDRIRKKYKEKQEGWSLYIKNLMASRFLLTSCWAVDNGENYLMWRSYTSKMGVCVRTTIDKLIEYLDYEKEDYLSLCSPVFYEKINYQEHYLESMLKKEPYYQSENEVRFYFMPREERTNEDLQKMSYEELGILLYEVASKEEQKYNDCPQDYCMYKDFDINPNFISSIVLSPLVLPKSIKYFRDMLKSQYSNVFTCDSMIQKSKITIK